MDDIIHPYPLLLYIHGRGDQGDPDSGAQGVPGRGVLVVPGRGVLVDLDRRALVAPDPCNGIRLLEVLQDLLRLHL